MRAGTRESQLAMRQTEIFKEYMGEECPGVEVEVVGITSAGDRDQETPLREMGGIGAFVRELDEALIERRIDVSVNSLKDVPVSMDPRLTIGAVLPRDDPSDAIVPLALEDLACGAIIGTSSVRRQRLMRTIDPKVRIKDVRGNLQTRLNMVDQGEVHAVIVSMAGLQRMGWEDGAHPVSKMKMVPAAGQGTIAVECRAEDTEVREILKKIDDEKTRTEVSAEREILRLMGAGCSSPIGINAEIDRRKIRIIGVSFDYGPAPIRVCEEFPLSELNDRIPKIATKLLGKG